MWRSLYNPIKSSVRKSLQGGEAVDRPPATQNAPACCWPLTAQIELLVRRALMANHPINLGLRFILELTGLWALGYWGWTQHSGAARWLWALGLPLLAATVWGVFRVPNDPGPATVAVPGIVRLLLEAAFFGGAAWALYASGRGTWALAFAGIVLLHYAFSMDRVARLLGR
jgi:hypothetical protein